MNCQRCGVVITPSERGPNVRKYCEFCRINSRQHHIGGKWIDPNAKRLGYCSHVWVAGACQNCGMAA